jgi:hypothetical protein
LHEKTISNLIGRPGIMIILSGLWRNIIAFRITSSTIHAIGKMIGFINNNN